MSIPFYKMSGSGNDFIIIDNREKIIREKGLTSFIKVVCARKYSVGANGLILIEPSKVSDFKWRFFNSDGSIADMCGNGARCVSRYAFVKGISTNEVKFETTRGIIEAEVKENKVKLKMPDPTNLYLNCEIKDSPNLSFIDTGVPHAVVTVDDIENAPVVKLGKKIRFHDAFMPEGTNVNFMQFTDKKGLSIRTYERGVEDETLACGTGAIACALIGASIKKIDSPINVLTWGGETLIIYFDKNETEFKNIYLEGDARIIYDGKLWDEGWMY